MSALAIPSSAPRRPVGVHTGRATPTTRDAVSVLSLYTALLFLLPGRLVVGPIGAVGTPALLLGMACALWWLLGWISPEVATVRRGPQPARTIVFIHGGFMMLAYAVAHLRPLTPLESSGSDRALLTLIGLSGLALIAADGVSSRSRLDTLLRRVVAGAAIMAGVGIVQFTTGVDPLRYLEIPGLSLTRDYVGVASRSVFNRPYGTALHPIEFGVVLGAVLPLALHFAFTSDARRRWGSWLSVWLIAIGIPISISRSAVVAVVAGGLSMVPVWSVRRRFNAALGTLVFTAAMWAVVPGLIGTIRGLFVGLESDPSIQARTDRVPRIAELFWERPWFGRGLGTYSVEDYFLIDNEWYVSAIETGLVGIMVILGFIVTALLVARRTGRLSGDETTNHLGYSIAAVLIALLASIGTFDAFFYRIFTGLLFLMVGCAGALWRLERSSRRWSHADG